jgi:hypothetical protein
MYNDMKIHSLIELDNISPTNCFLINWGKSPILSQESPMVLKNTSDNLQELGINSVVDNTWDSSFWIFPWDYTPLKIYFMVD